jgi:hypothetical protein
MPAMLARVRQRLRPRTYAAVCKTSKASSCPRLRRSCAARAVPPPRPTRHAPLPRARPARYGLSWQLLALLTSVPPTQRRARTLLLRRRVVRWQSATNLRVL